MSAHCCASRQCCSAPCGRRSFAPACSGSRTAMAATTRGFSSAARHTSQASGRPVCRNSFQYPSRSMTPPPFFTVRLAPGGQIISGKSVLRIPEILDGRRIIPPVCPTKPSFRGDPFLSFKSSEVNSADFKVLLRKTLGRAIRAARIRSQENWRGSLRSAFNPAYTRNSGWPRDCPASFPSPSPRFPGTPWRP